MPKAALLPYATALAARGYRAVLVDLRAQGESTGRYLGYGKQEASDLVQLLRNLRRHGLATGGIGLLGLSYGAAVALDTAALDHRIAAVVAVAPFSRVSPTIRRFLQMSNPRLATTIPASRLRKAIAQAGHLVGYPLNQADPLRAVPAIRAHVLYLAGGQDPVSPLRDVRALAAQTPHARLVIEPHDNHWTLTTNVPLIVRNTLYWFERYLPGQSGTLWSGQKRAVVPANDKKHYNPLMDLIELTRGAEERSYFLQPTRQPSLGAVILRNRRYRHVYRDEDQSGICDSDLDTFACWLRRRREWAK
jgi:dienelactone hydrolase